MAQEEDSLHRAKPPSDGIVVDIGAGQGGHSRADLILDKYIVDSFERSGNDIDLTRPLVVADGHRLPIKDRAIAYIVCSHVLEHAADPAIFAAELSRVARAGFVQVPSREAELTFGWPFHHWLIDRVGDTLVFEPRGDAHASRGDLLHDAFAESPAFRLWFAAHRSRWHHSIEWRERLQVDVNGISIPEATATFDLDATLDALDKAGRKGALRPLPPSLRSILCCPACHADLVDEPGRLICASCDSSYPVARGVPILLAEAVL
ncbi:MAG: methyltransferase domain-containing protein [Dongiaceae bacterium]